MTALAIKLPVAEASVSPVGAANDRTIVRLAARHRHLLPEDETVRAFVAWAGRSGVTGEQLAADLYGLYLDVAELVGLTPMSVTAFGRELGQLGLTKGKCEIRIGGKRYRPTCYVIPE